MAYNHPCGKLEDQTTLEYSTLESPIPCIYNDLCSVDGIPNNYECKQEGGCPSDCEEFYHMIKTQIKGIDKGADILERIVEKMRKDREKEGEIKLEDEVQPESVQDMSTDS